MFDKNGKEMQTGQFVRITGAYHKKDNALFYISRTPGDPSWYGKYHSLVKVNRDGTISRTKYNISEWPLVSYSNRDRGEANAYNERHAEIEVVDGIPTGPLKEHYAERIAEYSESAERCRLWGQDVEAWRYEDLVEFYRAVLGRI